jgi:hypothetical protein
MTTISITFKLLEVVMKTFFLFLFLSACLDPVFGQSERIPKSMVQFAETELTRFASKPEIVDAIQRQNARGRTIDEIKAIDTAWISYDGINRFMMDMISNDCALELWNFQIDHSYILEIFAMDNQGTNAGQTNKTSDYWQGDEAKFTESYNNGTGAVYYDDPEYDESVDELIIQISVPVMTGGRAVGAITFGISLDGWERR